MNIDSKIEKNSLEAAWAATKIYKSPSIYSHDLKRIAGFL